MRDLPESPENGRSFAVPDLIIAKAWADYHSLIFTVELDRTIGNATCEEVLSVTLPRFRRWTIWRKENEVVVATAGAPPRRFPSLPEALEGLGLDEIILSA